MITEQLFTIKEVTQRLEKLFGGHARFEVEWDGPERGGKYWYEIVGWNDGKRVDWVMTCEDLKLDDNAVMARFVNPIKNAIWGKKGALV